MISLAISGANQGIFNRLLASNHLVYTTVSMLDLNHKRLADVSRMFGDGQVTIDGDSEITRSCSLTLFDPAFKLSLDSASPSDGALFLDRMIAVYLTIANPDNNWQVTCPVFTGPLTKMDRDWAWLSIEAQGKEVFGLKEAWTPRTYYKNAYKTDVIRAILTTYLGEPASKMNIPSLTNKLPWNISISNTHKPWAVAKSLASGMGYQLFYDARGIATMRKYPTSSTWEFKEGAGGTVLSKPQVGYDVDNLINAVHVQGAIPEGKTQPIGVSLVAHYTHPLSPVALGRNGAPRYNWKKIEDTNIGTIAEATAVARVQLDRGLMMSTSIAFDSLVVPHLEPYDVTTLNTSEFVAQQPLRKYTIPLLPSGKSSVGYLRNSGAVNKARIRKAK